MVREDGQKEDLSKCPIWDGELDSWSDFKQQFYGHLGDKKAGDALVRFVMRWEQWTPAELQQDEQKELNLRLWSALTKAV